MAKRGPKGPSKYTTKRIEREAVALIKYAEAAQIPFEFEFATQRGYYSELLSRWALKNDKFYQALKKMKDIQTTKIVKAAMMKKIDVTMAIFTLKNVAGWRDKQELAHTGEIKGLNIYLPKKDKK